MRNLGPNPERVPLRPEVVERTDMGDYIREKVVFDSDAYNSVPAWVLIPKDRKKDTKLPGLLISHGHGLGKNPTVGLDLDGNPLQDYQHGMAIQFCRRGYVTISPDWRGFGERMDSDEWVRRPSRDGCNVAYLANGYFGFQYLNLQIWDGKRTIDYLQTRKEVNPGRIGCIGVSFGGTMTTYLTALDNRIKAGVICCYLSTLDDTLGPRSRANTCGAQFCLGLAKIGDIPDVACLIAPRPVLVEIGEKDQCFVVDDAMTAYRRVEQCYKAAGVPERCDLDLHPGGHEFSGARAFDWFDRWLKR